jgi:hypothetical protein
MALHTPLQKTHHVDLDREGCIELAIALVSGHVGFSVLAGIRSGCGSHSIIIAN